MPDQPPRVNALSPDTNSGRLGQLRELFPEALTEGRLDFDKLRAALGDFVDDAPERYSFSWAGKRDALRLLQMPTRATLLPAPEESLDWDTTGNLFIEGENLETLKLLLEPYYGQVRMIYLDPPYNTGNDFIYPDDYRDPLGAYLEQTGQVAAQGDETHRNRINSGRRHSGWLSMMYPRLWLARQLLRDDGVIFVSIDDNEVHNLRLVMNEVFGEENFVAQIAWQSRQSIQNDTDISVNHEYIVAYARTRRQTDRRLKETNASSWPTAPGFAAYPLPLDPSRFSNPDSDPRGDWKADPFDAPNIRPNLTYAIVNPATGQEHWPPPGRCWRTEEPSYRRLLSDGRIIFGRSGDSRPQLKVFYEEKKPYGQVENTWFTGGSHGTATHGTRELQDLFDGAAPFPSPKPATLVRSLLAIATSKYDIVLDFFAGSCTTAQAVLELNREDGGNRRFIMVQLPEPTDRQDYPTIAEIGKERIRRVIAPLKQEDQDKLDLPERDTPEDLGFRVFKLAPSNYRNWPGVDAEDTTDLPDRFTRQMELYADGLVDDWEPSAVIAEVALKEAHFGLGYAVETLGDSLWRVTDLDRITDPDTERFFYISLAEDVRLEDLEPLGLDRETLLVCRATALDDTTAGNLQLQCRLKVI
jgi:adenine-specific DNA-methyltransferase